MLILSDIRRQYQSGPKTLRVLAGVSLSIAAGEAVALTAPSGAGKSTLLHVAGLLERPDGGDVTVDGVACGTLSDRDRTRIRRRQMGFVYQFHHLQPEFTALENVMLPQLIAGEPKAKARDRAKELLARVGLENRADHQPAKLSGGERQRAALARALANRPGLLLADEPTGSLDPETAERVFALLLSLVRAEGLAALIATHNMDLARRMDRIVTLQNGQIITGGTV